jgi:hypothetical protein
MMTSADYVYYVIPKMENGINGGVVKVTFPTKDNSKILIEAEAMVFPVLIHELVKVLWKYYQLVVYLRVNMLLVKLIFLSAEPWDMRIGPALWSRFTDMIENDDFKLKHHIWNELVALPVKEFNKKMKERNNGWY